MKKQARHLLAALAALVLAIAVIPLSGCSSGSSDPRALAASTEGKDMGGETVASGDLSEEVSWQGVTLSIDPSWEVTEGETFLSEGENRLSVTIFDNGSEGGSFYIEVETFTDGETESLDSLVDARILTTSSSSSDFSASWAYTVEPVEDDGLTLYQVERDSATQDGEDIGEDILMARLVGYDEETGHGFTVSVYISYDALNEENYETASEVLQSVSYDPSQTEVGIGRFEVSIGSASTYLDDDWELYSDSDDAKMYTLDDGGDQYVALLMCREDADDTSDYDDDDYETMLTTVVQLMYSEDDGSLAFMDPYEVDGEMLLQFDYLEYGGDSTAGLIFYCGDDLYLFTCEGEDLGDVLDATTLMRYYLALDGE